jgi:hypothetical protein
MIFQLAQSGDDPGVVREIFGHQEIDVLGRPVQAMQDCRPASHEDVSSRVPVQQRTDAEEWGRRVHE